MSNPQKVMLNDDELDISVQQNIQFANIGISITGPFLGVKDYYFSA